MEISADNPAANRLLQGVLGESSSTSGVGLLAEYDSTDNFFYPRNGLSVTGEYQFYTNFLGGDYRYNTLTLDGKYFQPLSRDFTLVLGGNYQSLSNSDSHLPPMARPYIKLRGISSYRYQGDYVSTVQSQLEWQMTPRWVLQGFVGAGSAEKEMDNLYEKTEVAWGGGFRYLIASAFGLHTGIDVAFSDDEQALYFNVGSGLKLGDHLIPTDMFDIAVGQTRQRSKTENLRLDMWVFPFLNIYGLVGYTKGSSLSNVSVDADPSRYTGIDRIIASSVHRLNENGSLQNIDFALDFEGRTWGTGFTLAGGYKNWFTLVDTNYTRTEFDILDGKISAVTISPRVGYRFEMPGISGPSHLSLWLGAMYQNVDQEFKGNLSDLHMPAELQPLIDSVNVNDEGRFDVKQHLSSPWNTLLGAQYEITKNFNMLTEFGFNDRNSFFLAGEYRF